MYSSSRGRPLPVRNPAGSSGPPPLRAPVPSSAARCTPRGKACGPPGYCVKAGPLQGEQRRIRATAKLRQAAHRQAKGGGGCRARTPRQARASGRDLEVQACRPTHTVSNRPGLLRDRGQVPGARARYRRRTSTGGAPLRDDEGRVRSRFRVPPQVEPTRPPSGPEPGLGLGRVTGGPPPARCKPATGQARAWPRGAARPLRVRTRRPSVHFPRASARVGPLQARLVPAGWGLSDHGLPDALDMGKPWASHEADRVAWVFETIMQKPGPRAPGAIS